MRAPPPRSPARPGRFTLDSAVQHRPERVGNLIRSVLADAVRTRLSDPRIEPLTTITHVTVAPDLTSARVYVSVLAPEPRQRLCLRALQHAARRLRLILGDHLATRQIPELTFFLDDSIQRSAALVDQLDQLVPPCASAASPSDDTPDPPDSAGPAEDQPPAAPAQEGADQ